MRALTATLFQLAIAAGVLLLIEIQRRVAMRDDRNYHQRPRGL